MNKTMMFVTPGRIVHSDSFTTPEKWCAHCQQFRPARFERAEEEGKRRSYSWQCIWCGEWNVRYEGYQK